MGRDGLVRLHSSVETEQLFLKSTKSKKEWGWGVKGEECYWTVGIKALNVRGQLESQSIGPAEYATQVPKLGAAP